MNVSYKVAVPGLWWGDGGGAGWRGRVTVLGRVAGPAGSIPPGTRSSRHPPFHKFWETLNLCTWFPAPHLVAGFSFRTNRAAADGGGGGGPGPAANPVKVCIFPDKERCGRHSRTISSKPARSRPGLNTVSTETETENNLRRIVHCQAGRPALLSESSAEVQGQPLLFPRVIKTHTG